MKLRPEVQKFAEEMEKQLRANEHKGGWEDCDSGFLMSELEKNFNALWRLQPSDKAGILRRATNIANFAMMIADNWGGEFSQKKPEPEKDEKIKVDMTKFEYDTWENTWYVCPNCGFDSLDVSFGYCPYCGKELEFEGGENDA